MPALAEELKKAFPDFIFEICNQAVNGTRVGYGLWGLTNKYEVIGVGCVQWFRRRKLM